MLLAKPSQQLAAPGMTVKSRFNEPWGAGTVLGLQGTDARVLFTSHPSGKPVLVPRKSLEVTRAGDWTAAAQRSEPLRHTERKRRSTRAPPKRTFSTTTQDEAIRLFLERFPGGFDGERFEQEERGYKQAAHRTFADALGDGRLRTLLERDHLDDATHAALRAEQMTNLLSRFEKARLHEAMHDARYARSVLGALAEVLVHDAPHEASFRRYLDAVEALPARDANRRATWPIATILPFLANPTVHLFVKPLATRAAAERLEFDLQYRPALNWNTYARAHRLGCDLRDQLAPHGCRDLIDVQSFIWVMA